MAHYNTRHFGKPIAKPCGLTLCAPCPEALTKAALAAHSGKCGRFQTKRQKDVSRMTDRRAGQRAHDVLSQRARFPEGTAGHVGTATSTNHPPSMDNPQGLAQLMALPLQNGLLSLRL